jgi:antitoxin component of RelBE/YafQ-DinJ toxin-antitoxin module
MTDSIDDIFDQVFAEDDDQPVTPEPEAAPEPEPAPELPEDNPLEDGHAEEPEETPEETPEESEEKEDDVDYKALLEKERQRFKSFEGRYKKEKEQWEQARHPAPKEPEAPKDQAPDPDAEFLDKFRKEYNDDVIKAVELISTKKARQLLDQVAAEKIVPIEQAYARTAQEAHFHAIQSAHKDWEDVVGSDGFNHWVEKQPGFLKAAYMQVLERGTSTDVIDLLSTYKGAAVKPPAKPDVNPAKAKAASAVKPTGRGAVPSAKPKTLSFDEAWDEAPD